MDTGLRLRAFGPPAKDLPEPPGRIEQSEEEAAFAFGFSFAIGFAFVFAGCFGPLFGGAGFPRLDHDVARRYVDQAPDR
jgi:hypothetical protein